MTALLRACTTLVNAGDRPERAIEPWQLQGHGAQLRIQRPVNVEQVVGSDVVEAGAGAHHVRLVVAVHVGVPDQRIADLGDRHTHAVFDDGHEALAALVGPIGHSFVVVYCYCNLDSFAI